MSVLFGVGRTQQDHVLVLDCVSCIISSPSTPTCNRKKDIPFTVPPRFTTQNQYEQKEAEEMRMEVQRDVLAHRGSLSVSSRSRPTANTTHTHSQDLVEKRLSLLPNRMVPGGDAPGRPLLGPGPGPSGGPSSRHGHSPLLLCGVSAQQRAAHGLFAPPR